MSNGDNNKEQAKAVMCARIIRGLRKRNKLAGREAGDST